MSQSNSSQDEGTRRCDATTNRPSKRVLHRLEVKYDSLLADRKQLAFSEQCMRRSRASLVRFRPPYS